MRWLETEWRARGSMRCRHRKPLRRQDSLCRMVIRCLCCNECRLAVAVTFPIQLERARGAGVLALGRRSRLVAVEALGARRPFAVLRFAKLLAIEGGPACHRLAAGSRGLFRLL